MIKYLITSWNASASEQFTLSTTASIIEMFQLGITWSLLKVDTTQATASDRVKLYIKWSSQITSFEFSKYTHHLNAMILELIIVYR
jgi:hypothetical protein